MNRAAPLILPAYLLACLLLGGSAQGMWGNAALQLLAIAILAWAALSTEAQPLGRPARHLLLLVGATILLVLAQLIPLPPALWSMLPGRQFVVAGFQQLAIPLPWLPISLSPADTLATAVTLLPPLALLIAMMRLHSWSRSAMFAAVGLGTAVSILLGVLQLSSGGTGAWYFYERTNLGVAVGVFANGNHFATLLMAATPLLAALAASQWRSRRGKQQRSLAMVLAIGGAILLLIGALLNGSSAMLLIGPPVLAASALLAVRLSRLQVRQGLMATGLLLLAGVGVVGFAGKALPGWGTGASIETRVDYWSTSLRAIADQPLTGSGIGTFLPAFRRFEDPARVDRFYVNHAHNDYLELLIEAGLPAAILLLGFFWWWGGRAAEAWRGPGATEEKAAVVASAAILLHSLIDYPLRTAAIAALFAVCLAVLAGARGAEREEGDDEERRARHATL